MNKLVLSSTPQYTLELISYPGQPVTNRLYKSGYEKKISKLPNPKLVGKEQLLKITKDLNKIGTKILEDDWLENVSDGKFQRNIIGIEEPVIEGNKLKEGQEIVVANWGKDFSTPVHGHSEGFLYEELLSGAMIVHTYNISDLDNKRVRPATTSLYKGRNVLTQSFIDKGTHKKYLRESYVHNFVAIEPSHSIHYVPEHTRDGRDNVFTVEHFQVNENELKEVTSQEVIYSPIGSVILVRSTNVPEYKDHYIVITGPAILKPHGLRPQEIVIQASDESSKILDKYQPKQGVILLKLSKTETEKFHTFHT